MNYIKTLILLFIVLLVSACGETRYITKEVAILPPDHLLARIEPVAPVDKAIYLNSTWSDREAMLVKSYKDQTSKVNDANIQFLNIQKWKKEQDALYNKKATE